MGERGSSRRSAALVLAGFTVVVVVAGPACRRRGADRVPAGTPVILISIDTLRADHVPAYGYGGVATRLVAASSTPASSGKTFILIARRSFRAPAAAAAHALSWSSELAVNWTVRRARPVPVPVRR